MQQRQLFFAAIVDYFPDGGDVASRKSIGICEAVSPGYFIPAVAGQQYAGADFTCDLCLMGHNRIDDESRMLRGRPVAEGVAIRAGFGHIDIDAFEIEMPDNRPNIGRFVTGGLSRIVMKETHDTFAAGF